MTDDLVVRLRCYPANRLCRQVADALEAKNARIAELEAENAKLKAKLWNAVGEICDKATRAALGEKHDNE